MLNRLHMIGIVCGALVALPAIAAPVEKPKTEEPTSLEVTAEQSLEWYQDQRLYVARGKARAVKGTMIIDADILTAHQREKAEGDASKTPVQKDQAEENSSMGDIDRMTAEGNVRMTDPRQQVFGERAVYDLDKKVINITGNNLKYLTANEVITARDSMEYYENENLAVARGNAVGVQKKTADDQRKIEGDVLTAQFSTLPNGEKELTQLFADGHVTIITKGDISRGNRAVYDVKRNMAILEGNVRITHGGTQLAGDKAEVNFANGHSRLLNEGKRRVRAMMMPASETTKNVKKGSAQ